MLEENYVLDTFVQLALALKHVHDRKIIHRDIKTENIFLSSHKRVVKLGDFGIAKVLESTLQQARTAIGTPYYLSPEICQGKLYNFKSDIWSLGVVLYELCALRCPFAGANMKGLMLCISKGSYAPIPSSFSSETRKLIADMLNLNPKLRPSINELLRRPILQQRISKLIEGSVLKQEFSHTVLHGQHYSKSKCPNPCPSPAPPAEVNEHLPAEADRHRAAALKHVGRTPENQNHCLNAQMRAAPDAKAAVVLKPQLCQANVQDRDKVLADAISEKREKEAARVLAEKRKNEENAERERRDRAAMAAEKAERDRRERDVAKILAEKRENEAKLDREKRERELARHKELHQQRVEKEADAVIASACWLDRAQEDRAKQKKQQILALEDFRQRQAKQWLGGAAQPASCAPAPSDPSSVRKEISVRKEDAPHAVVRDADVAAARRLWSARSPAPNSVDQVKARGAALKVEEQQKYEQALAIARKQAWLERLAAEDRRQRELHCAFQDVELLAMNMPAAPSKVAAVCKTADCALAPACQRLQPAPSDVQSAFKDHSGSPRLANAAADARDPTPVHAAPVAAAAPHIQHQDLEATLEPESYEKYFDAQMYAHSILQFLQLARLTACRSEADKQEEACLREIVGELMHLTLHPCNNASEDESDDDVESSSVFEKIESLRIQLESRLGTQNFLQLYELARACQDGCSGKLESQMDCMNVQDADVVFNSLVQLLNFETEVYSS